jgi:hypothetical protein
MSKINEFDEESLREIAKEVVTRRLALMIHVWAYILVNLLVFVINILVDYTYPWHFWVLTGWGLALVFHLTSYIIYKKGIEQMSAVVLLYHIGLYFSVNIFLFFIDWFTTEGPGISGWAYYPLIFWGLALIANIVIHFNFKARTPEEARKSWMERKVDQELQRLQKK